MNAFIPSPETEEEEPLDPATERVRRKMVRLLIVSIGIMVIGLMAVFGAIIYKIGEKPKNKSISTDLGQSSLAVPDSANYIGMIDIPDGATVTSTSLHGSQILLHLNLADGSQKLWLYDIPSGRQFGSIDIK